MVPTASMAVPMAGYATTGVPMATSTMAYPTASYAQYPSYGQQMAY